MGRGEGRGGRRRKNETIDRRRRDSSTLRVGKGWPLWERSEIRLGILSLYPGHSRTPPLRVDRRFQTVGWGWGVGA